MDQLVAAVLVAAGYEFADDAARARAFQNVDVYTGDVRIPPRVAVLAVSFVATRAGLDPDAAHALAVVVASHTAPVRSAFRPDKGKGRAIVRDYAASGGPRSEERATFVAACVVGLFGGDSDVRYPRDECAHALALLGVYRAAAPVGAPSVRGKRALGNTSDNAPESATKRVGTASFTVLDKIVADATGGAAARALDVDEPQPPDVDEIATPVGIGGDAVERAAGDADKCTRMLELMSEFIDKKGWNKSAMAAARRWGGWNKKFESFLRTTVAMGLAAKNEISRLERQALGLSAIVARLKARAATTHTQHARLLASAGAARLEERDETIRKLEEKIAELGDQDRKLAELSERHGALQKRFDEAQARGEKSSAELAEARDALASAQRELRTMHAERDTLAAKLADAEDAAAKARDAEEARRAAYEEAIAREKAALERAERAHKDALAAEASRRAEDVALLRAKFTSDTQERTEKLTKALDEAEKYGVANDELRQENAMLKQQLRDARGNVLAQVGAQVADSDVVVARDSDAAAPASSRQIGDDLVALLEALGPLEIRRVAESVPSRAASPESGGDSPAS